MAGSTSTAASGKPGGGSNKSSNPFSFMAPSEPIKLYSLRYFEYCAIGGTFACGLTHMAVTPLDLVKCNVQANPHEFKGLGQGFGLIYRRAGFGGLLTGWGPTLAGYSVQGALKFGLYEYFKHYYATLVGPENAHHYRDLVYLAGSASAEFFADMGLAPFEALKVRMQTTLDPHTCRPTFARGLLDGLPKLVNQEGLGGVYKGIVPLWFRQIPYTMMKFLGFERTVEAIYRRLPKKKEQYNKLQQLGVSFAGGYIAGVFCAVVSHPADSIVSILNKDKTASVGSVWRNNKLSYLLTKGLGTRILMVGTLTGLQWLIYDTFKTAVGLPTTGGAVKK